MAINKDRSLKEEAIALDNVTSSFDKESVKSVQNSPNSSSSTSHKNTVHSGPSSGQPLQVFLFSELMRPTSTETVASEFHYPFHILLTCET